jgi:hypothetical protein
MKLKYLVSVIACGSIFICAESAYAAKGGIKGPALEAFEKANENDSFKRGNGNQLKKGTKELNNLDKALDNELEHDNKDDKGKDKKDKDTQLEKSLKKESKNAIRKAIK